MSKSALYQTITVSSGFFVYGLGVTQMDILTPMQRFGFGTIFIFLAILRNIIGNKITGELLLEIDHNLKLLHDFGKRIGAFSKEEPITVTQGFNKVQQVVTENPSTISIHTISKNFYLAETPIWHHKIFNKSTSLTALSKKKKQAARFFYDKLNTITLTCENLRTSKGATIIRELENNLENIICDVLEQGNPLKNPLNLIKEKRK